MSSAQLPTLVTGPIALIKTSQTASLALYITFSIISTLAVTLRVVARYKRRLPLLWDDYLIIIAQIFALGVVASVMVGVLYCGVGLHVHEVEATYGAHRVIALLKVLIPVQILWAISLSATKLSILMFYVRVFNTKTILLATKIIGAIIVLWCITVILNSFLFCRPFAYNWNSNIPDGHCGNRMLSFVLPGIMNILSDVLVLGLPIPVIWTLKMKPANKIALSGVFATGLVVCISCVLRLISLVSIDYSDITFSVTLPFIWSMIEPCATIALACLPVIKFLVCSPFRSLSKPSSEGYSSTSKRVSVTFGNSKRGSKYIDPYAITTFNDRSAAGSIITEEVELARSRDGESQKEEERRNQDEEV